MASDPTFGSASVPSGVGVWHVDDLEPFDGGEVIRVAGVERKVGRESHRRDHGGDREVGLVEAHAAAPDTIGRYAGVSAVGRLCDVLLCTTDEDATKRATTGDGSSGRWTSWSEDTAPSSLSGR
jgi:hypothetical protein